MEDLTQEPGKRFLISLPLAHKIPPVRDSASSNASAPQRIIPACRFHFVALKLLWSVELSGYPLHKNSGTAWRQTTKNTSVPAGAVGFPNVGKRYFNARSAASKIFTGSKSLGAMASRWKR